jgi:putative oxidoreductase
MIDLGLLMIRVALGALVAAHGAQKLFGWWGGGGVRGTARMFESLGFRPGRQAALLGGTAELGGGLLMALGLLTPIGSLAVIVMMIGAIASVHLPKGWWNTAGGMEFPALVGAVAFGLVLTGPGGYSLDDALHLSLSGGAWALGVLAAAIGAGVVIVAVLRASHATMVPTRSAAPATSSRDRAASGR